MDPVEALQYLGGEASRADLLRQTTRRLLERAVLEKQVERAGWGRYALATLPDPLKTAAAMYGVLSHESAAEYWCLKTVLKPARVHITVPPRAHRSPKRGVTLHYSTVPSLSTTDRVTPPVRTVIDCARTMPFREGLAIADSALRIDLVSHEELREAVHRLTGRGHLRARKVIEHASGLAENPFESALRAVTIEAGLLDFRPQVRITEDGVNYRVDLGDECLRLVAEADSFEYHGERSALERDCRRYDELTCRGWLVLRFSWEQVMFDPEWVRRVLEDTVQVRLYQAGGLTVAGSGVQA